MTVKVAIAVSSFRSDDSVIKLLEEISTFPSANAGHLIVVDSLGSGRIPEAIAERGLCVHYENFEYNLGSAGNLARRMALASELGADWCYCLNHDASWEADRLTKQLNTAVSKPRIGAVYTLLHHGYGSRPWEDGRFTFTPAPGDRYSDPPKNPNCVEVVWGNSNSALYATAPYRDGIRILDELWMGYEDLAYGIALSQGGWSQLVSRDAVLFDSVEYKRCSFFGRDIYIPDKPVWYSFYNIRNLLLIRKKFGADGIKWSVVLKKFLQSTFRILLFEDQVRIRLKMLFSGAVNGLRGCGGKGPFP